MRVKKFTAKTMKDALRMIKEELGPEAVILAARDVKRGQGQGEVEVTAAVSEFTLHKKKFTESRMDTDTKERFRNTGAKGQRNIIEKVVDRRLTENNRNSPLSKVLGLDGQSEMSFRSQTPVGKLKRNVTSVSYIDIPDEVEEESFQARAPKLQVPRTQHPRAPYDNIYMGYAMLDQAIRVLNKQPLSTPLGENLPYQLLTAKNLPKKLRTSLHVL